MTISSVRVTNFRSIDDSGRLALGSITILTGPNNSGKSAFLHALHLLAASARVEQADVRIGAKETGAVEVSFDDAPPAHVASRVPKPAPDDLRFVMAAGPGGQPGMLHWAGETERVGLEPFPAQRPAHFIVPIFARRRSDRYEDSVKRDSATTIQISDRHLTARIASLSSGDFPASRKYTELANRILGLRIGTFVSENGQQPGMPLSPSEGISLDHMGDGVSAALSLIVELAEGSGRLYLIEEPENDLHPRALTALLGVIMEAASGNQFVISTHSDLVLRQLGSHADAKIFGVSLQEDTVIPTSQFREISTPEERIELLLELGYDAELPRAWILFEESSAETICKQILIPRFAPALSGCRTLSTKGTGNVEKHVAGVEQFVLYCNLSRRYHQRIWVVVDGDSSGLKVVSDLREHYPDWESGHFTALTAEDFETYYPSRFQGQVEAVRAVPRGRTRQELKTKLLLDVCEWAIKDPDLAASEFAESASEVIDNLQRIVTHLQRAEASS